ncbi:apolipo protein O-domain-containing protein [Piptocephalis cylindrospora]|uniref:MICOS complex subunit n=1 Tax=Piptocephalis cylindrospora TaxID=1907219 RepID=A0A4P9Y310_9FUNG|nr:apolipo protein O-domain-containing protein [Piptocephalis cylindrospora]|eukprot:RKP13054.1 apolipo protein O-domain-containing protein [Piptocephalis cylindrospora]
MTQDTSDPREQLNIYREPQPVRKVDETPTRLQLAAKETRTTAQQYSNQVHERFQYWINRWIHFEERAEHTIKSLKQPGEPLMPGLLYVGASGLASLIVARRRNILIRAILPPLTTLAAASYFVPRATDATLDLVRRGVDHPQVRGRVEQHAPEVIRSMDLARSHASMTKDQAREWRDQTEANLNGWVSQARQEINSLGSRVRQSLNTESKKD